MPNPFISNRLHRTVAEGTTGEMLAEEAVPSALTDHPTSILHRAVVLEVIADPLLLDDKRIDYLVNQLGIENSSIIKRLPRNTIVAQQARDGRQTGIDRPLFYLPFFSPHLALPIKAGEHVWVVYEDPTSVSTYGYWLSRIADLRNVDDLNFTHNDRKFDFRAKGSTAGRAQGQNDITPSFHNGAVALDANNEPVSVGVTATLYGDEKAYQRLVTATDSARGHVFEPVPRYTKRPGDHVIAGSNNAFIILGTDRNGSAFKTRNDGKQGMLVDGFPQDDQTFEAGTIDLVVGLGQTEGTAPKKIANSIGKQETDKREGKEVKTEGDIDFDHDSTHLYLSMKTNADQNFKLASYIKADNESAPSAVLKTSHLRLIARKSIRMILQPDADAPEDQCASILIKDGNIVFIPAKNGVVKLGGDDATLVPLCTRMANNASGSVIINTPIVDTMGGIAGQADGANGTFPTKVLFL